MDKPEFLHGFMREVTNRRRNSIIVQFGNAQSDSELRRLQGQLKEIDGVDNLFRSICDAFKGKENT